MRADVLNCGVVDVCGSFSLQYSSEEEEEGLSEALEKLNKKKKVGNAVQNRE